MSHPVWTGRNRWLAAVLGTGAGLTGTALAQPPTAEVVVTATRVEKPAIDIPAAVGVVSQDDVQLARQQIGLDESLVQVPGLFMQNRFNFAQDLRVSIRGFGARANFGIRGIRIFVDGIPETLPDGQGQVDSIDLGSVQQITVLRGAASALYGNASGGVILIESEDAPEDPTVEARFSLGELGFAKHQLKAAGQAGRLGYMVNFADFDMDGFRDHSRVESQQVNATLNFDIDPTSNFRVALNATDQPVSDDPGALTAEQALQNPQQASPNNLAFDAGESLEQQRIGLVYNKRFGDAHSISARNYYVWRDFENALPFQDGGAVTIDRFFVGGGLTYTHTGTLAGRANRTMIGVDYDRQDDDRKRFNNDFGTLGLLTFSQNELVTSTGVFVQNEWSLLEKLELTAGLRYDRVEFEAADEFLSDGDESGKRTLEETSPMVGLLYTIAPSAHVYANVSTSFETPTTTEFANPSGAGGLNPALDPQIATNYELGVKGTLGEQHRYALALFSIDVEDELIPFELAGMPGRDFFRNAGSSRRKGIELAYSTTPVAGLDLSFAYTYSDFTFEDFVDDSGNDFGGNEIPGLPQHVLFGEIAWRHPMGVFAALDATYVDGFYVNNANTRSNPSYTLSNVRLGYSLDNGPWHWSVFGGVNNLFDEDYNANTRINAFGGRFFEPGPELNAYAGTSFQYSFGR